jgi:cell pole-organizing protein PopZ
MSDERQRVEPSMDEILASIRRLITEDTERSSGAPHLSAAAAPALAEAEATYDSEPGDELLLTEMLAEDDDDSVVRLPETGPAGLAVGRIEPVTFGPPTEGFRQEPTFARPAPVATVPPAEAPTMAVARTATDQLMSQDRAKASSALLRELVRAVTKANELSLGGDPTLEALVREALAPLLRNWLDANLPAMVERLVKAEIDRVVARAEEEAKH